MKGCFYHDFKCHNTGSVTDSNVTPTQFTRLLNLFACHKSVLLRYKLLVSFTCSDPKNFTDT